MWKAGDRVWAVVTGTTFRDGEARAMNDRLPAVFVDQRNPNGTWCRVIWWWSEEEERSGARGQRSSVDATKLEPRA